MPLLFPSILKNDNLACNRTTDKDATVRQKLAMMATTLEHLANKKQQLNLSAEKARIDIRKTVDHYISTLRQCEYKLLEEVEHSLQHENKRLEDQTENLNQAIGACKIMLEKMPFANELCFDEFFPTELVQRINLFAEMPAYANIIFNGISPENHLDLTLGHVSIDISQSAPQHVLKIQQHMQKGRKEDSFIDDKSTRCKRSSTSTCSSEDTAHADEQQQMNVDHGIIRDRLTSTSLSIASFDVISAGGGLNGGVGVGIDDFETLPSHNQHQNNNKLFSSYFNELNCLPIDNWLRPTSKKAIPTMDINEMQQRHIVSAAANNLMVKKHSKPSRRHIPYSNINWAKADLTCWLKASKNLSAPSDSFGKVINSVLASPFEQWLLLSKPTDNKMPFSTSNLCLVDLYYPMNEKTECHQTVYPPFMMKNGQQPLKGDDTNNNNLNIGRPALNAPKKVCKENEALKRELDKLSSQFETVMKTNEHSQCQPNELEMVDCCYDDIPKTPMADEKDHPETITVCPATNIALSPFPHKMMNPPVKLPNDPSHWLKQYPPPKQNRPMNEMAEDLYCWESVLGWKSILEKIHGSGEDGWLAPSSRAIKNGGTSG